MDDITIHKLPVADYGEYFLDEPVKTYQGYKLRPDRGHSVTILNGWPYYNFYPLMSLGLRASYGGELHLYNKAIHYQYIDEDTIRTENLL